ncbi:hypothetical protein F7725_004043 [Dissostichus mawsoni]|uniref:Uncharacterized protein n=1 Tax=Dissostichus mawsoni TaxID=36200 RepID=A0A7J5YC26_DISMA|nr:hypothetical protein F7725_004043 [Dissostichus mawsoni]
MQSPRVLEDFAATVVSTPSAISQWKSLLVKRRIFFQSSSSTYVPSALKSPSTMMFFWQRETA